MKDQGSPPVQAVASQVSVPHLAVIRTQIPEPLKPAKKRPDQAYSLYRRRLFTTLPQFFQRRFPVQRSHLLVTLFFRSLLPPEKWNHDRRSIPHCSFLLEELHIPAGKRSQLYLQRRPSFPLWLQAPTFFCGKLHTAASCSILKESSW